MVMSENQLAEIESVLADIKIVMAGKRSSYKYGSVEREVYYESYQRLIEDGEKLIEIRASFKDFIRATTKMQVAKIRMDVANGIIQPVTETDEKEDNG